MTQSEERPPAADGSWHARATEALSSISEAVYFLDSTDHVTWLNAAAERLLERPAGDLVGRHVFAEFPDLADTALAEAYRSARASRQSQQLEFFYDPLDRWF